MYISVATDFDIVIVTARNYRGIESFRIHHWNSIKGKEMVSESLSFVKAQQIADNYAAKLSKKKLKVVA